MSTIYNGARAFDGLSVAVKEWFNSEAHAVGEAIASGVTADAEHWAPLLGCAVGGTVAGHLHTPHQTTIRGVPHTSAGHCLGKVISFALITEDARMHVSAVHDDG